MYNYSTTGGKNDGGLKGRKDSRRTETGWDILRDTALHCLSERGLDIVRDVALRYFGPRLLNTGELHIQTRQGRKTMGGDGTRLISCAYDDWLLRLVLLG